MPSKPPNQKTLTQVDAFACAHFLVGACLAAVPNNNVFRTKCIGAHAARSNLIAFELQTAARLSIF